MPATTPSSLCDPVSGPVSDPVSGPLSDPVTDPVHDPVSDPTAKRLKSEPMALSPDHFTAAGEPRVCELFAGSAVMSCILQTLGFVSAMLAENATHLVPYLKAKCPAADVAGDVHDKPWLRWLAAGLLALVVVAGVPCQPFSEAGRMRFGDDSRAWDALLVCDAALALKAAVILLENVLNYVDRDHEHGVFTRIQEYYLERGYVLVRVLRIAHCHCAGRTYRKRIVAIFVHRAFEPLLDLTHIRNLSFCTSPPDSPVALSLDRSRNWLQYSTLRGSSMVFDKGFLVPGAVVKLASSSRLWRVQRLCGDKVHLQDTNRRSSERRTVNRLKVTPLACEEATYSVFQPTDVVTTIRASGEPPGYGGPIMLDSGGAYSLSVSDRAHYNDVSAADLLLLLEHCTVPEVVKTIGNIFPKLMAMGPLTAVAAALAPLLVGYSAPQLVPTSQPSIPWAAPALSGGAPSAAAEHPCTIAYIEILPLERRIVLNGKQPRWLQALHPVLTGNVKAEAQKLLPGHDPLKVLVPAGTYMGPSGATHVLAAISSPHTSPGDAWLLSDLAGDPVYPLASLALAKVLAHMSGHTTARDLAPLLSSTGEFAPGALLAKQLNPPRVNEQSCPMSRGEALQHCRAIEVKAELSLKLRAESVLHSDPPLHDKLLEWSHQVTIIDLKDIPDALLSQMPSFEDPGLLLIPFSHTAVIPVTASFEPPAQPDNEFAPSCNSDLWVPDDEGLPPKLEDATSALHSYFDLMWEGGDAIYKDTPFFRDLAMARPSAECWGLEHTVPEARAKIWDISNPSRAPKLVDFNQKPESHLRLDLWMDRFKDCDDQQLVCHLNFGVCSMANLDYTSTLAPPLLSMAEGIGSISSEIQRLVGLSYLAEFDNIST